MGSFERVSSFGSSGASASPSLHSLDSGRDDGLRSRRHHYRSSLPWRVDLRGSNLPNRTPADGHLLNPSLFFSDSESILLNILHGCLEIGRLVVDFV